MKKTFTYLSFIIFLGWFPSLFAGEIYVSLQGNDKNPGTKEAPFNTLNRAIKQAREWRRLNRPEVAGGIYIRLEEGVVLFVHVMRVKCTIGINPINRTIRTIIIRTQRVIRLGHRVDTEPYLPS